MTAFYNAIDHYLVNYDDYDTATSLKTDKPFKEHPQELMPAIENVIGIHKVMYRITS
jgi:hypothetical protein